MRPNMRPTEKTDPKGALNDLSAYMRRSLGVVILALVLAALSAVLTIIGPDQVGKIATIMSDGLLGGIDLAAIARVGILLAVIYGLSALFGFIQHYIMASVTLKMSYRMRAELSEKINRVPQKYFNLHSQGDILSRITNDVSTLQQGLTNSLPTIISAATQFVGCLIMMFVTEWRMALAALCVTVVGLLLTVLIMSRSQRYFVARQESLGKLNGYIEEMYSGHEVVRISRAGSDVNAMRRIDYAARKDAINAQKRAAYQLRQKNRGQKVFITDQAIQKVPLVAPNGADHQTALFIQETHRELLRFAQKQNDSNEVACLLDLTANEKLPFVKGDQAAIDIEKDAASYHWLRSKSPGSIMFCHNHPGQSYFSLQDVAVFLKNDSVGTMSIVTNQGKVWTISKTSRFDYDAAFAELRKYRGAAEKEWDDVIDNFLKNGYAYGIGRS